MRKDDDRMDLEGEPSGKRDFFAEFGHDMDALNGSPSESAAPPCYLQPVSPDFSVPLVRANKQTTDSLRELFPPSQVAAFVQGRFASVKNDVISAVAVDTFLPFPSSPSPLMALWRAIYGTCQEELSWQTCELMSLQNLFLFCCCEKIEDLLPAMQRLGGKVQIGGRKYLLKETYKRLSLRQQKLHAEALDKFYARDDRSPAAMNDFMRIIWVHGLQCARIKEWFIMELFGIEGDVRLSLYSPDIKVPFAALSESQRQTLMTDFMNLMLYRKRAFGTDEEPLTFVEEAMGTDATKGKQWYDPGWMTYDQCIAYARYLKVE